MDVYILSPEDVALLEEPYGVAVAVLGHEGEEVGGLGTGGEVEGVVNLSPWWADFESPCQ